jgi:predicted Zn finger-like uncharacterized protein
VIVSCPNCDARYKLPDAVLARGGRLKCAACAHRWVPEVPAPQPAVTEADEEAAFAAVQEQISARWAEPAVAPRDSAPAAAFAARDDTAPDHQADDAAADDAGEDATEDETADGTDAAPRPTLLRNLVAGLAGLALSIAAAGLWVGRVDVAAVPWLGPALARLAPPAPLDISVTATTTTLPSGRLLVEVRGIIRNSGRGPAAVPDLRATLSGPAGTALRWTIVPNVRRLPPGTETEYSSTVTGFPAEARQVAITPARLRLF